MKYAISTSWEVEYTYNHLSQASVIVYAKQSSNTYHFVSKKLKIQNNIIGNFPREAHCYW